MTRARVVTQAWLLSGFVSLLGGVGAVGGCHFRGEASPLPTYFCDRDDECASDACSEGVCAAVSGDGYALVLRVLPAISATRGAAPTFTFQPAPMQGSEDAPITLPPSTIAYGTVRFGDQPIAGVLSFRRREPVASRFYDEQPVFVPSAAWADDDGPADYRVAHTGAESFAFFTPGPMSALLDELPARFVGLAYAEVFPPLVRLLPAPSVDGAVMRHDFVYPTSLFAPCTTGVLACTTSGRVLSRDAAGALRPEAGVRVYLESSDTEQPISTIAVTDAEGNFVLRASSLDLPHRLRLTGSPARTAFPQLTLGESAFDVTVGGDVEVPHVDAVRYLARVEFGGGFLGDALVRAVSTEVVDDADRSLFYARFEASTRTTLASSAEGEGYFSLDLVEGSYDLVVSHEGSPTAVTRKTVVARRPTVSDVLLGQAVLLSAATHLAGTVRGPDGALLPYTALQALPFRPQGQFAGPAAYARAVAATSDSAGLFAFSGDVGFYDLVARTPFDVGLAPAVLLDIPLGATSGTTTVEVMLDHPAVRSGIVRSSSGDPIAGAKIEAYAYVPGDTFASERVIPLGEVLADDGGAFRLSLPSRLERLR